MGPQQEEVPARRVGERLLALREGSPRPAAVRRHRFVVGKADGAHLLQGFPVPVMGGQIQEAAVRGLLHHVLAALLLEFVHVDHLHGLGGGVVEQREEHRP